MDGSGISKIADVSLATALRAKVNAFNVKCGAAAVAAAALYAVAPTVLFS